MKRLLLLLAPVGFLLGVALLGSAQSAPVQEFPLERNDFWLPLFNGRDLTGWHPAEGEENVWLVKDGVLTASDAGAWLVSDKTYKNFELHVEFKIPPDADSGIFLRAPERGNPSFTGMEVQLIDDNTQQFGRLSDYQKTGAIYSAMGPKPGAFTKANQWQTMVIRADGPTLEVRLNNQLILDADLEELAENKEQIHGLARDEGHLGLQSWGSVPCQFRTVKIRELP